MIGRCKGYRLRYDAPFFREVVVECPVDAAEVCAAAREKNILAGIPLERYFGEGARRELLVAVTEKRMPEDFEALCAVLEDVS